MSKYNINVDCTWQYAGCGDTMLEAVKEAKIFSIKKLDNDKFEMMERCDDYFIAHLTKDQLVDLANELLLLSES